METQEVKTQVKVKQILMAPIMGFVYIVFLPFIAIALTIGTFGMWILKKLHVKK